MELSFPVRCRWREARFEGAPPEPRCGHVAVAVAAEGGGELVVVHGGINAAKEALADVAVLRVPADNGGGGAWSRPHPDPGAGIGPAARAFHCAAAVGADAYVFGGHIYVREAGRLHQYGDLWALDTRSWAWRRLPADPDARAPAPRDRACLAALPGGGGLLLYGGADASNRRLDDCWVYPLPAGPWVEVAPPGPRPRARCCAALFALGDRAAVFGGDGAAGALGDLWALRGGAGAAAAAGARARGAGAGGGSPRPPAPAWTPLALGGPAPCARRGHAHASLRGFEVFFGGLGAERGVLGIKRGAGGGHLSDVGVLEANAARLGWRAVEAPPPGAPAPAAREKHTLVALAGGARALLLGGTDGHTTLGDAWWLDVADGAPPRPPVLLAAGSLSAADVEALMAEAGPPPPSPRPSPPRSPRRPKRAPAAVDVTAAASGGYWPSLPAAFALPQSMPALPAALAAPPAALSAALSSLRGRIAPAAAAAAAAAAPGADDEAQWQQALAAGGRGACAPPPPPAAGRRGAGAEALRRLGARQLELEGHDAGAPAEPAALLAAARRHLVAVAPDALRLGDVPALLEDYRSLARCGWALAAAAPAGGGDEHFAGRYSHLAPGSVRLGEVAALLADYRRLLTANC